MRPGGAPARSPPRPSASAAAPPFPRRRRGAARARVDDEAVRLAADALGRAPRVFAAESLGELYRAHFPEALARVRTRAAAILAHEIDVFGAARAFGDVIDWRRDPLSGKR